MTLVEMFGQLFQLVNGPGTTSQGNFALRRAPPWAGVNSASELVAAMSPAQISALTTMASWAEGNLQGETGVTTLNGRRVPSAAARMAEQFRGSDFGGLSRRELAQRRKAGRIDVDAIEAAAREAGVATRGS